MNKKISHKDIKDWENFLSNKDKLLDKEINLKKEARRNTTKKIDLHGVTLEGANEKITQFINECYNNNISKIIVITGKGLRSNNKSNPYVSQNLSILKYSVPEFIQSDRGLMKMIIDIKDATIEDGGAGAFYIFLKNKLKK